MRGSVQTRAPLARELLRQRADRRDTRPECDRLWSDALQGDAAWCYPSARRGASPARG